MAYFSENNMKNIALNHLSQRHPKIVTRKEKMYYVLAALASMLIKADGVASENEVDTLVKLLENFAATASESEHDAYTKGMEDYDCKAVKLADILEILEVFESREEKLNLLKILIKIASADGTLDKAEYSIIFKVSNAFAIPIPEFESLAEKLNIATGNAARTRQFEIASGVLKTIGKGVVATAVIGFQIIELFLQDGKSQPRKRQTSSSKEPTSNAKPKDIQYRAYRSDIKNCALCRHWYGQRKVEPAKKQVLVALHGQPNGICTVSPGGKRKVLASHTCANFSPLL